MAIITMVISIRAATIYHRFIALQRFIRIVRNNFSLVLAQSLFIFDLATERLMFLYGFDSALILSKRDLYITGYISIFNIVITGCPYLLYQIKVVSLSMQ